MCFAGGKNIELAIMKRDQPLKILNPEKIEKYVAEIEKRKKKKTKRRNRRKHRDEVSPPLGF